MKNKAVFLDRDGTIIVEKNYLDRIEDIVLLDNTIHGLKKMQKLGYLLIIVSNQSGVARGYYTEEKVHEINNYLIKKLAEKGILITDVYYCPHLPGGKIQKYDCVCVCRKPKTGMIDKAKQKYDIDVSNSFMIGDKSSDMKLAQAAGCQGILIENSNYEFEKKNYIIVKDLLEAANLIEHNSSLKH